MRDPITTRKLLAKIDRDLDVFVVLDRMRQAIYDLDDYTGRLDARIHALEEEKRNFVTDTGLNRKLEAVDDKKTANAIRDWRKLSLGEVLKALITIGIGSGLTLMVTKCGH